MKKKTVKTPYINNADMLKALVDYRKACEEAKSNMKPKPKMPDYIGNCFIKIANNLAKRGNFSGYSFKEEMILDAIENQLLYYENFSEEKTSNPFSYFTQICWYSFLRRIEKEKKQQYLKYKSTENWGALDEEDMYEDVDSPVKMYDNQYEFMKNYENMVHEKELRRSKNKTNSKVGVKKFIEE